MDKLTHLFATATEGVWAINAQQQIVFWNRAAEAMLGYRPQQALGRYCYELLAGHDRSGRVHCQQHCAVWSAISRGRPVDAHDLCVRRCDGSSIWISVSLLTVVGSSDPEPTPALVHVFRTLATSPPLAGSLRIHLLGPIEVLRADGTLVEGPGWRRARTRALLAFLATSRTGIVHRDALLEALWPGFERASALSNLNTTVYYLRECLEPNLQRGIDSRYARVEGDCYVLAGRRSHWVDVEAFEALIQQGRRAAHSEQAERLYRQALSWYRGDYLADLDPDILDCWMERERLRELFIRALEDLADLCARQGRGREANDLRMQALAQDPCRETAVQALMRSALARHDSATATKHYLRFRDRMMQDLDLQPSEETRLLYEEARRGPWRKSP